MTIGAAQVLTDLGSDAFIAINLLGFRVVHDTFPAFVWIVQKIEANRTFILLLDLS